MHSVVVGTGSMAPEIAAALAVAGPPVVVTGRSLDRAEETARRATALAGAARPISAVALDAAAFAGAGLVVETIAEELGLKREVLARIEPWCPAGTTLVSNTSSLRIADIASALTRPEHFAGLHFLKPAHLTAVVEVVPGPATGGAVVDRLEALAERMGKAALVVRADVPGFIWNRIQFAVLRECLHMLEAGVADAADIDAAVSDGLAPRWMAAGPLATADLGGLAVFATISQQLFPHLADGHTAPPELTERSAEGRAFAPWTAQSGAEVSDLRARALEMGREIAARRRELGA